MTWLLKFIAAILVNGLLLYLAAQFIPGFVLMGDTVAILEVALVLTLLNALLKPILKLIFTPIIILSLGLGLIIVNAVVLYVLDILLQPLTIQTTFALVIGGILVSIGNSIFHGATKN